MGNPIMGDRTNLGSCHRLQTHFGSYEQSIYCFCNDFLSGNIYNSLWIDSLMWGGGLNLEFLNFLLVSVEVASCPGVEAGMVVGFMVDDGA